jgi:diguanylate cyclase (GGDEF)-like protein
VKLTVWRLVVGVNVLSISADYCRLATEKIACIMPENTRRPGPDGGVRQPTESLSLGSIVQYRMLGVRGLLRPGYGVALLSVVVAVVISVTAGLMIWHNRQSALEEHQHSMNGMGIVLAEQTSRYVQVIDLMLHEVQNQISISPSMTSADFQHQFESKATQSELADRVKNVSQVDAIVLVNADGQAFNSSRVGSALPSATERDYYIYLKAHDDPGLFIGSMLKSRATGELSLSFARRVSRPDGTFLGLVLGIVQIKNLSNFYRAAGEHLGETIALLRRDGTVLLRFPDPERAVGLKLPPGSAWYRSVREGGGSYTNTPVLTGVVSLISSHPLRDYPLVLTIAMDEADVFARWHEETVYIAGFALASGLAFVGLFAVLGRQFRGLSEAATRLNEGKQILSAYAAMSADWFWEQDANFCFKFCTDLPFMITPNDVGKTRRALGDPAMAGERWATHEADLAAARPFRNFRWERIGSDGKTRYLSTSGDPLFDRSGRHTGYRGTGRDVTLEVRATARLGEANARLAQANSELELGRQQFDAVLSNVSPGVCFFSAEKRLRLCNRRYAEIYNLAPEATQAGQSLEAMMRFRNHAGSEPAVPLADYLVWWDTVLAAKQSASSVVTLRDGRSISIHYQFMPDGGWVATHEDITDRQRAEQNILFMARHDALTRLANRALFNERMEQAIAMAGRGTLFAVFCLDLDKFKQVNDTLGHPMGDALLMAVADRLQACVREVDTVARLGGDEFAIIQLSIQKPDDAEVLASRIIAAFAKPFDIDSHQIAAGVSIGVAVTPDGGAAYETLMRQADTALYLAKTEGRGTARFFEPDMDARINLRRVLEQDLQGAIARNELELYYQPQINLNSNRISGFEALLRWHHPNRGLISPAEFIPLAEETGMIVALGEWVVRTACFEARNWPHGISVAVNLSPVQFKKGDLVKTVQAALEAAGLRPARLELEITETVVMHNTAETLEALHQLRELGISVALDDFGTGYSSLNYLHSFPFSKIKIDQSFVRDLTTSKKSLSIVRAVVGLGESLGMMTLAEGVETKEQLDKLREKGCTEVQGYYFSRPRPASEVPAMIEGVHAKILTCEHRGGEAFSPNITSTTLAAPTTAAANPHL